MTQYTFYQIGWIFLIYAFLGWCFEVVFAACKDGKFVNRGFLNGPVCPIYGFGVLSVVICLTPLNSNLFLLFLGSMLFCSTLEFITGWLLEKIFHQKWWDYSKVPFNIKGYICLAFSLAWGFACVFVIRLVHPAIMHLIKMVPHLLGLIIMLFLFAVFISDLVLTVITLLKLPKKMKAIVELESTLRHVSTTIGTELYESTVVTKAKNEKLKSALTERNEEIKTSLTEKGEEIKLSLAEKSEELKLSLAEKSEERKAKADEFRAALAEKNEERKAKAEEFKTALAENNFNIFSILYTNQDADSEEYAKYKKILGKSHIFQRRIFKAFPNLEQGVHQDKLDNLRKYYAAKEEHDKDNEPN